MQQIISAHNKSILKSEITPPSTNPTNKSNCSCGKKECPLDRNCLTKGVVYQAKVTRQDNLKEESYVGLTELSFKTRLYTHTHSFKNENQRNATALSQYVWSLSDNNVDYNIKWKILARSKPYSTTNKRCNLCLTEKYFIIHKPEMSTLNNRNELVSGCRHRRKHLLSSFKPL